jgi:YgiT-type zinc finger domain-containing protein
MKAKTCPICGQATLVEKQGDFHMDVPPNIPGGSLIIANAEWQHCDSCGEDILSKKLEQAINRKCRQRKKSQVA